VSRLRKGLILAVAIFGVSVAPAHATTGLCVPIAAEGVGQDLGNGNTTATITTHGLLLGTTTASFTITGAAGTTVSFVGPLTFTTALGTMTAQVAGTLDSSSGAFESRSTSLTGTGLFRHVTGNVRLVGVENLQTGAFSETISGRLCV